jgi:hypothetical protein
MPGRDASEWRLLLGHSTFAECMHFKRLGTLFFGGAGPSNGKSSCKDSAFRRICGPARLTEVSAVSGTELRPGMLKVSQRPGQPRGVPRTSSAKKGGDPEYILRGLRGRRAQGPVPSGPARGGSNPARLGCFSQRQGPIRPAAAPRYSVSSMVIAQSRQTRSFVVGLHACSRVQGRARLASVAALSVQVAGGVHRGRGTTAC